MYSSYLCDKLDSDISLTDLVNTCLGTRVSNLSDSMIVLCALAGSVSYEEICSVMGYLPGTIISKVIPSLEKEGLIKSHRFEEPDGTALKCFICTRAGLSKAIELIGDKQVVSKTIKKGASRHSYGTGYNLYQLLRLKVPFTWYRESPYDNPFKIDIDFRAGTDYRTDCLAHLASGRILRIEEDRDEERSSVLYNKLQNYESAGCFADAKNVLIFSVKVARADIPKPSKKSGSYLYSRSRCRELLGKMVSYRVEDASYLLGHPEVFSSQEYLAGLIRRASEYGVSCVDIEFLNKLCTDLSPKGYCLMQHEDYNRRHSRGAMSALRYCATSTIALGGDGVLDNRLLLSILKGAPVGFCATTILSKAVPYLALSDFPYELVGLMKMIDRYCKGVEFIGEVGEPFYIGRYKNPLVLRNNFISSDGTEFFVEFPCYDMGSWVRIKTLLERLDETDRIVQVLCVFNSQKEAEDFFTYVGYDAESLSFNKTHTGLYGLYMGSIWDNGEMFTVSGEDEKIFVPVMP